VWTIVVEDAAGELVACGSIFVELKFTHECGKVGHIEDIVVGRWRLMRVWRRVAACDVWRVTCGVWRVACGVWRVTCGVWRMTCGVWRVACGVWRVACGV
jgi:hypothetical protein